MIRSEFLPVYGRRTRLLLPLLALTLALPTGADRAAAPFAPDAIRAQIAYFASDELKGRGSGEPGNEKAAQFVARAFAKYGLKPLGTDRQRDPNAPLNGSGYYQPFTFRAGRAVGKTNLLEATRGGKTRKYRAAQEFEPSGISGSGAAEGEVIFVGYGIRAEKLGHDDYAGADVKDKLVLLLAGHPKNEQTSPLAEYANLRLKALTARELGAKALLVIPPKNSDTLDHNPLEFAANSDAGLPVVRVRRAIAEVWLKEANLSLPAGVGGSAPQAAAGLLDQWGAAADSLPGLARPLGLHVRLNADVKLVEKVSANIVGFLEGSDPVLKNEVVVIGAHVDHLGMGGPNSLARTSAPAIHHGADDNASGAAGVLQLAQYYGRDVEWEKSGLPGNRTLLSHRRSLLFICFSGEELGLLGSAHYVKNPLVPLDKTVAMLNMDMIGRLRENKLTIIGTGTAKEWNELVDAVNGTAGFTLSRNESGFGGSDHQSFYEKGVPVLFFFTGQHAEYHTPDDTVEKINTEGEARVLKMVAECARRVADAPMRPTYQQTAAQTQPGSASRGFRVYFGSRPEYDDVVKGVKLSGVTAGSPAEKAGLKAGDVIVSFGGKAVTSVEEYSLILRQFKPGDEVEVVVKRGDQTLTFKVTLAARPGQ